MRELYRAQAKAIMTKQGYFKNKWMRNNHWRELTGAYPVNCCTGKRMDKYFHGRKRDQFPIFSYSLEEVK